MSLFSVYRRSDVGIYHGFLIVLAEDVDQSFAIAKAHDAKWGREFRYSLQEYNGLNNSGVIHDEFPD